MEEVRILNTKIVNIAVNIKNGISFFLIYNYKRKNTYYIKLHI